MPRASCTHREDHTTIYKYRPHAHQIINSASPVARGSRESPGPPPHLQLMYRLNPSSLKSAYRSSSTTRGRGEGRGNALLQVPTGPMSKATACLPHLFDCLEEIGNLMPQHFRIVSKVGGKLQGGNQALGRSVRRYEELRLTSLCETGRQGGRTNHREESNTVVLKTMATRNLQLCDE